MMGWYRRYYEDNIKGYIGCALSVLIVAAYLIAFVFEEKAGYLVGAGFPLSIAQIASLKDAKRQIEKMIDIADRSNEGQLKIERDQERKIRELESELRMVKLERDSIVRKYNGLVEWRSERLQ